MSTKIFYNDNRIIIDGHADTPEECQAITAMCDSLAKDTNFKTIVYEKGHAVFERVSGGESMMFAISAMKDYVLTSRYDAETGYSAAELAAKGTINKRLNDIEQELSRLWGRISDNEDVIEDIFARLATLDVCLTQVESRIKALENKLTKTLPYTVDELIAKLESI